MALIRINRRKFIKTASYSGVGFAILASGSLANSPSSKLNIALIGCWGRGSAHWDVLAAQNVVALCDVDEKNMALAAEKFPRASRYVDWRKCLEQKDIDAVLIATTDFTHAHISTWAMNRGYHVYCEKPLANSVEEARTVRATYLKNKSKLATQLGTQRHAFENFPRLRELVQDGAIGEIDSAHVWSNRQLPKPGYPPLSGKPPKHLHYDLWIGPSPFHPYNPEYFAGRGPGWNCLQWNMYWDFGNGQLGDMGTHTMDLVWNAMDLEFPATAEAKGDPFNPEVTPVEMNASWSFNLKNRKKPLRISWHQGGSMPSSPLEFVDLDKIKHGALFKGEKGFIVSSFGERIVIPYGKQADFTYYKRRPESELLPGINGFQEQWINACKGEGATSCDFDYAGRMCEMLMLGMAAYRSGEKLNYDAQVGKSDSELANGYFTRQYREGWPLNG